MENKQNKNTKKEAKRYEKPQIEELGKLSALIKGNSGGRQDTPPFITATRS